MNPYRHIDERVAVVATYRLADDISLCIPVKMRWRGQDIGLSELGLRHPTTKGQRMLHVFEMSDGSNDYRLEFDAEALTWTLTSVSEGAYRAFS